MDDFPDPSDFLADARRGFREFYTAASVDDTKLMDSVVMAHAAVVVGMNTRRRGLDQPTLSELERVCLKAEMEFTRMREALRACPTYQRVSEGERWAIETSVCQVKVPEE